MVYRIEGMKMMLEGRSVEYGRSFEWTTTPPTQEGWYWAKRENDIIMVEVADTEAGGCAWEAGLDYPKDFADYSAWLGPLPVPEPPQEG